MRGRKVDRERVEDLIDQGLSVEATAAFLSVSVSVIYGIIRQSGLRGIRVPTKDPLLSRLRKYHPEYAP